MYGIQLWGCTKKNKETFENKVLRNMVDALWLIKNNDIHRDLKMEFVDRGIQKFAASKQRRLLLST